MSNENQNKAKLEKLNNFVISELINQISGHSKVRA